MSDGIKAVISALARAGVTGVEAQEWRQSVVLEGHVDSWQKYIDAGYAAAGKGYKGVVNDVTVEGIVPRGAYVPPLTDTSLEGKRFDVIVIGGGVIGCAVARELTRWDVSVAVLEKEDDVAKQTSSRNNGMIHPGIAASYGTKKFEYNIRGNRMYSQIANELGFKFSRCGSVLMLEKGWHRLLYPVVRRKALKNGVAGIELWSERKLAQLEPNVTPHQHGAVFLPSTGVVAPYQVTIAYGENAIENGADIFLNTAVLGFEMDKDRIIAIRTNRGKIWPKLIINAAGVWADVIAGYADDRFFSIHGRKGTIAILDKKTGKFQTSCLSMPRIREKSHTKGGGVNPTVEGNILMGPTAVEVPHREDWSTCPGDIHFILNRHLGLNTALGTRDIITYFSGIRACTFEEDFIIEISQRVKNLVYAAGIQSPGLAAAPAIAVDVAKLAITALGKVKEVRPNPAFNPRRRARPDLADLSLEERSNLICKNPAYGKIICRCEAISEGEVVEALKGPISAHSTDAVKRRIRAGMGRCQGGFCTPALIEVLAREVGVGPAEVCKNRPGSELLAGETKGRDNARGDEGCRLDPGM